MKFLLIANTIYEKLRRVKVNCSQGGQWKLMEGIVMLKHCPECANYENRL